MAGFEKRGVRKGAVKPPPLYLPSGFRALLTLTTESCPGFRLEVSSLWLLYLDYLDEGCILLEGRLVRRGKGASDRRV